MEPAPIIDIDTRNGRSDPTYVDQLNRSADARSVDGGHGAPLDTDREARVKHQLANISRRDSLGNNSTTREETTKISLPEIMAYNQNYN